MQRLFGTVGLYIWSAVSIVTANILVVVTFDVTIPILELTLTATLGNALYNSSFLVTDALCEQKGRQAAQKAVWIGFVTQIVFVVIVNIALLFEPAGDDWAFGHVQALFSLLPRIALASLFAYFVSQLHDVWLYERIKKALPKRSQLWLRNNLSTIISQFIDTVIFVSIAFIGVFTREVFFDLLLTTFLFKVIVAFCDTPFVYLLTSRREKNTAEA